MTANAALDFMEEITQLHEDYQACHGQPNVTKKLLREIWTKVDGTGKEREIG